MVVIMLSYFIIFTLISIPTTLATSDDTKDSLLDPKKYIKVYSQCDPSLNSEIHTNNGLYYIKPSEDGPVIPVICSNGYTMIDLSLDINLKSIPLYLSSYDYSRGSLNYVITNLDDTSTFRQWWLPSDKNTKFRIAPDCASCEQSTDPLLNDNVVYYTDSSLFCFTSYTGADACEENINEYSCNICDAGMFTGSDDTHIPQSNHWSSCTALQSSSDTPSWHEPFMRVNHHLIYRPVMNLNRASCTCYQQQNKDDILPAQYMVHIDELPDNRNNNTQYSNQYNNNNDNYDSNMNNNTNTNSDNLFDDLDDSVFEQIDTSMIEPNTNTNNNNNINNNINNSINNIINSNMQPQPINNNINNSTNNNINNNNGNNSNINNFGGCGIDLNGIS
eukprot:520989_1